MAKDNKKAKKSQAKTQQKPSASVNRLLVVVTLAAVVPFSLPTVIVLFVGLLPTMVAAIAERGGARLAWICVGGLNVAGLYRTLFRLWFGNHDIFYALELVRSVDALLLAYGAAGLGWLLYLATPAVVSVVMLATSQRRAAALKAYQKDLVEQWGPAVAERREQPPAPSP